MYSNLGSRRIGGAFEALAMIAAALMIGSFLVLVSLLDFIDPAYFLTVLVAPLVLGALALAAAFTDMTGKALPTLILISVAGGLALVLTLLQLIQFQVIYVVDDLQYVINGTLGVTLWIADFAPFVLVALAVSALVALSNAQNKPVRVSPMASGRATSLKVTGLAGIAIIGSGIFVLISSATGWGNPIAAAVLAYVGLFLVYIWVASAIANMAERKGRSWPLFFWLAFLVSWVIMLIIAAAISPLDTAPGERTQPAAPPAGNAADPTEQMRNLQKLRAEGLITEAEFAEKRKQLLERL